MADARGVRCVDLKRQCVPRDKLVDVGLFDIICIRRMEDAEAHLGVMRFMPGWTRVPAGLCTNGRNREAVYNADTHFHGGGVGQRAKCH